MGFCGFGILAPQKPIPNPDPRITSRQWPAPELLGTCPGHMAAKRPDKRQETGARRSAAGCRFSVILCVFAAEVAELMLVDVRKPR